MARILVVDDEIGIREFVGDALEMEGHEITPADSGEAALRVLDQRSFDLVVTDLRMPGVSGMDLVRRIRSDQPETEVIVLTAHGTVESAVEAMKLGAFDFLQKPLGSIDELGLIAKRALERRRLRARATLERRASDGAPRLGYGDPTMAEAENAIARVAPTNATVLLLGESGTGKELAARKIHQLSERADQPFVAVNCAALTATLLESELFGHERGAFTGANERRQGRIELAEGGTFFLDEVGELRPELQAKLLRVIQERRFERVGGTRTITADVRWIAATNRDLSAMIAAGEFREDLYHRLAVFPIELPPLRNRTQDLLPMANLLLDEVCSELKRPSPQLTDAAAGKLIGWSWPGNVRELRNVLERAAILADETIEAEHLWLSASSDKGITHLGPLSELERAAIVRALAATGGNRRRAAEILGIGERTLYDKLKRYDITS